MRLAALCLLLLVISLPAPAQRKRTPRRPKVDPQKKVETPCGISITYDEFLEEIEVKWRRAAESDTRIYYYNTGGTCDTKTGVFKTWVKLVSKDRSAPVYTTMQLFEFKCRARQSRLLSMIDYALNDSVLERHTFKDPEWQDVIPESTGESTLLTVCRLP